ncbi:MAG: MFS transporter, partial [Phycisphaerae bacterium]
MRRAETRPADLHASSIALPPVQVPRDIRAIRQTWTVAGLTFFCMVPVTLLVAPLKELVALPYGASSFWTHSFMSVNMIGAVLAAPLIGRLADRRRRRVAVFALVAEAGFLCAMGWAPGLAWLLILRFLEGAAHILALSTLMAIAASWAQPGRRGRVMGLVGAAMMFGTACGTRLGGLAWRAAPDWTFQTAGAVALIAAFTASLLLVEPTVPAHRS